MEDNLQHSKTLLRKKTLAELKNLPPDKHRADSGRLRTKLKEQSFFLRAGSILFFAPMPNEVDVWPLLEEARVAGKTAALPQFDSHSQSYVACRVRNLEKEIVTGQFGIREPSPSCPEIPPRDLDLVLVPGVAFDLRGHRLGRGQGFYDRLLANVRGLKCGVAFDEQIVNAVPAETRDVRMDFIVTPARLVKVTG